MTETSGGVYERRQGAEGTKHVFLVPGSDGLVVAQVVVEEGSAARRVQYLHQDAQGSVTLVTNADGSAAKSGYAYYEPFGRRIERMGAPVDGAVGELRLGLTGHEHDDELGLINLKGRMYDPKLTERGAPDIASAGRAAHRAALNRQWRTTTATAYVVATSSSSELFGGRRPSVLPEK